MTALLLQTLLLMIPAFFVGAALACGVRHLFSPAAERAADGRSQPAAVVPLPQFAKRAAQADVAAPAIPAPAIPAAVPQSADRPRVVPATSVPAPAAQAVPAPAPNRFDETLTGRPADPARPVPAPAPPPAPAVAVAIPLVRAAPPPPPPATVTIEQPARVADASSTLTRMAQTSTGTAAATAAAAAAAAVLASQAKASTPVVSEATPAVPPPQAVAPVPPSAAVVVPLVRDAVVPARRFSDTADDLTRISMIDPAISEQLENLGITKFGQIAAWQRSDVAEISKSLGFQGRIEQENWIEQAQVLNSGSETHYSSQRAKVAAAMAAAPDVRAGQPVVTFENVTRAPAIDAGKPEAGTLARVEDRAAFATIARDSAAVVVPLVADAVAPGPEPLAAPAPVAAATPIAGAPAVAIRPGVAPSRDALQRIATINGEVERLLAMQGVTRYNQIASWGPADVEKFDRLLGSQGRIGRENWVEQAQMLAKGGDTAFSRDYDRRSSELPRDGGLRDSDAAARPKSIADAIRANAGDGAPTAGRPSISGLRSVRSDAYRPPADAAGLAATAATAAGAGSAMVVRSADADDLKRIRGVGVLIEKKLNSIGIVSYDQIAEWTTDDIDRVSASLDFKGRIERENWVEQARILSAGGHTEFSRRVDGGEVSVPKPR